MNLPYETTHFGRKISIKKTPKGWINWTVRSRNGQLLSSGNNYENDPDIELALRRAKMAAEMNRAPSYKA